MTAKQLFELGKVREAVAALGAQLRDKPADAPARTFLFELLCASGEWARAEKQLAVLAQHGGDTELAAVLYYSALHADKIRHELFQKEEFPRSAVREDMPGTLNGKPFRTIRDADPEIGPRLEVFAAGAYLWLPFEHISSLQVEPPRRLRDTLWAPARVITGPSFQGTELGEVLVPTVYPFSHKQEDESLWLGRTTAWFSDGEGREYPMGQKLLLVDGEEIPFLEVRSLEFDAPEGERVAVAT